MTACDAAPVSAPMKANFTVFWAPPPLGDPLAPPLLLLLLHAAATMASTAIAAKPRSDVLRDKRPLLSFLRAYVGGSYHKPQPGESRIEPWRAEPPSRCTRRFARQVLAVSRSRIRVPSCAWSWRRRAASR